MLLKQLRYFVAVVNTNSFTEAAEQCFISQSAISQQIKALEDTLGAQLLTRHNRKFTLTPAGEYFYKKGSLLLDEADALCRETANIAHTGKSTLRIGYLRGYSGPELRRAVAAFAQKYPKAEAEIIAGSHEALYDALRQGGADIVLNDQRRAFSSEYINEILSSSECYIELNSLHPLAKRSALTANDLKALPCILVAAPAYHDNEREYYRDIVGLKSEFIFAESLEQAQLLVLGGKGYMPVEGAANAAAPHDAALCRLPLLRAGKPIMRNYCAFWRADNESPYVAQFAEILKQQFQK